MKKEKLKEGIKYDFGKSRYDLIDPYALEQVIQIYTFGCNKYEDHNWRKGMKWSRVFGALMRHCWAFWRGEEIDPESKLPHMAHAAWNCLTLINYSKYRTKFDDRWIETEEKIIENVRRGK
jgi:hypothetical protein